MPDNDKGFKHFFLGILQNATWDGLKQAIGGSAVTTLCVGIYQYVRHQNVDWWGLLVLGCAAGFFMWLVFKRHIPQSDRENKLEKLPDLRLETERQQIEEIHKGEVHRIEVTHNAELSRARECYEQCKAEKKVLAEKLELFTTLQVDALSLSSRLLGFIEAQGKPPLPKYTREEIDRISLPESRRLIDAHDGDYAFACEYHFGQNFDKGMCDTAEQLAALMNARFMLMDPWYEKIRAGYDLEFRTQVEQIHNRFAIEGLSDDVLKVPVQGRMGIENICAIAKRLWELAFKLREKAVREKGIKIEAYSVQKRLRGEKEF